MRNGLINAIIAYTIWGLLPIYWKWFETMPAGEILSHRIIWSFVFVAGLIAVQKRWKELKATITVRSTLVPLIFSSLLITANWLIFIWAVNNGHVVETSIGYYLTPLFNVVLAILFLREKPTGGQWIAVALAAAGVLLVAIDYGSFPWVSISLALSFGFYGLVKKRVTMDASIGLMTETMIVVPVAVIYWGYLGASHADTAWSLPISSLLLLLLSGVATATPLLLFAKAAKKLPLSMLGFVQYIGPTLTLLISVLVFKETISSVLLISFCLIWTALVVYAMSSIRAARALRPADAK
ncbi:EamA family transporter RarD [Cohnella cholangitidis]|uniref:EamA family transporter RarD n=1 Tax=Cohnella cholangitidis TaxID=2598458 RepID=A0A7G5BUL8_9BACL|nr:EamA family transporter RarD [Cohnella cholangitidis]QMV40652.1 EamA family transporter RarD [Cohnella cholangitidis]